MRKRTGQEALRFAEFVFVTATRELYRDGRRVRLRPQASVVLGRLLQRPGQLVSRRELQTLLWGETIVDAEAGLNHCVRQVRRALGDRADEPRFVATEPRRGYRFVAPVAASSAGATPVRTRLRASIWVPALITGTALLLAAASALYEASTSADEPPPLVAAEFERARFLLGQPGPEPAGRAVALLEGVTRAAPEFAAGHAALARALLQSDPTSPGRRARHHAERALQIAPTLAEGLVVRGDLRGLVDRDWAGAELDFRRAHRADPELVEALHHRAGVLAALGRDQEAIDVMHQALEIDPVSPLLAGDLAWFYFVAREWESARMWARRTLALDPDWGTARSVLLHASSHLEDEAEVRRYAEETLRAGGADEAALEQIRTAPDPLVPYWHWWDARLKRAAGAGSLVQRALIHVALGRGEQALDDLLAAETAGYLLLPFTLRDPRFDAIRGEPRYNALLDRLRLPREVD